MQDDSFQDNIVCKITSYKKKIAKKEKREKLPSPHKLLQGAPAKSVEGGVKISKTCLPPVCPLCLPKILEEGPLCLLKILKGMGSVPPPLNEALQGGIRR